MSTISLADAIAAEPPRPRKGPECAVRRFRATLEPADQKQYDGLLVAVAEGNRTQTSVSRIMAHVGFKTDQQTIGRHVKGECACPRDPDGQVLW